MHKKDVLMSQIKRLELALEVIFNKPNKSNDLFFVQGWFSLELDLDILDPDIEVFKSKIYKNPALSAQNILKVIAVLQQNKTILESSDIIENSQDLSLKIGVLKDLLKQRHGLVLFS